MRDEPKMIRANVIGGRLAVDRQALAAALAALPQAAPVVIMLHGYRYTPALPASCPHTHLFAFDPIQNPRVTSWPRQLGLDGRAGLGIAFGWPARGFLPRILARTGDVGGCLAELARLIRWIDPARQVDVAAHSLGARVALTALAAVDPGIFRRIILLAAAETRQHARAAMATPAGRLAQVINVTTRENDLFDFLFEWCATLGTGTAIGQGLGRKLPNWTDLQIDQPATLVALARLGYPLAQPPARISHWSPFLRPGVFALYRALISGALPPALLSAALPLRADRRWSRLLLPPAPLPSAANPA
jgi:hypothetical protein